jgi:malate synthase
VTSQLVRETIASVLESLRAQLGPRYDATKFPQAAQLFEQMMLSEELTDFLTLQAYQYL